MDSSDTTTFRNLPLSTVFHVPGRLTTQVWLKLSHYTAVRINGSGQTWEINENTEVAITARLKPNEN